MDRSSFEYMLSRLKSLGFILHTPFEECEDADTEMIIEHPCGDKTCISYNEWEEEGLKDCDYCTLHEEIWTEFHNRGLELLTLGIDIKDRHATLRYRCKCGVLTKAKLQRILEGKFCKECERDKIRQQNVPEKFAEHGCELLSKYVSNNVKLMYRCNRCQETYESTMKSLDAKIGPWCPCANIEDMDEDLETLTNQPVDHDCYLTDEQIESYEWEGGIPGGCISDQPSGYQVCFRGESKWFGISKYGTDEEARKAADEWRLEKSNEKGLTKNRYAVVMDKERGIPYVIMRLQGNLFTKLDWPHIDKVQECVWSALKGKGKKTYYARCKTSVKRDTNNTSLHTYLFPEYREVDHINRNGLDNRSFNIREGSGFINVRNRGLSKNNKSGTTGVTFDKRRYRAGWTDENGKKWSKSFSIDRYGEEKAKELAMRYRKQMERKIE